MAQQTINVGTSPNDGTGTPLRTAFQYTNSNFSELYTAVGPSGNNIVVPGTATITGDLTVDTSTLKVDSANNRVGIGTASPQTTLDSVGTVTISGGTGAARRLNFDASGVYLNYIESAGTAGAGYMVFAPGNAEAYRIATGGTCTWSVGGSTAMTLNSTGLGVGGSPASKLYVYGANVSGIGQFRIDCPAAGVAQQTFAINGVSQGQVYADGTQFVIGSATSTPLLLRTANTVAVTIDASQNVGIGVTPSAWGGSYKALQLQSVARNIAATGAGLGDFTIAFNAIYDSTDSRWEYAGTGDKAGRYSQTGSGNHRWFVSNTAGTAGNEITDFASPAMTLDASGNLLVGKTANYGTGENNTLQLKSLLVYASDNTGSASNRNWAVSTNGSAAGNMEWTVSSSNNGWPNFAYRMQLTSAGAAYNTTGTWGTISDSRLKENISDARNYLADLLKLRVVKYSLKEEASAVATKLGLIAQEVEQVFPSLVEQSDVAYDGGDGIRTVKTSILVPMLLKAIQELTARVQTLEAR